MDSRENSNFILFTASLGVVIFHLQWSRFYIGYPLDLQNLTAFFNTHGIMKTVMDLLRGVVAMVGLFFINSGYGLSKSFHGTSYSLFIRRRLVKIILYAFLAAITCSLVSFFFTGQFLFRWLTCLTPIFGFYETTREFAMVQYWFLSLLISYYLIFPFLIKIPTKFLIILSLSIYILGYVVLIRHYEIGTSYYHSTIFRLPEFILGILLARLSKLEKFVFEKQFFSLVVGIFIFFVGYAFVFNPYTYTVSLLLMSSGVFLFLSQISLYIKVGTNLSFAINFLSSGTLTLYLFHMATIRYAYDYMHSFIYSEIHNKFFALVIDMAVLIFLSFIIMSIGAFLEKKYHQAFIPWMAR